jgi:hypothetical protein
MNHASICTTNELNFYHKTKIVKNIDELHHKQFCASLSSIGSTEFSINLSKLVY